MRVVIDQDPLVGNNGAKRWDQQGHWPCAWIATPGAGEPPFVTAYRLPFTVDDDATVRIHVSADERYELFLDGRRIGRGAERGAPNHWFFESYDLPLPAGTHMLVARVWSLGERAPFAQMQVHHGFLLAAEGAFGQTLGTGNAPWEAKRLPGYTFERPPRAHWKGDTLRVDGSALAWGFEQGLGDGWEPATILAPAIGRLTGYELVPTHLLRPATLPPMIDRLITSGTVRLVADGGSGGPVPLRAAEQLDEPGWGDLVAGTGSISVPAHTSRRVLIDLDDYYCAYPELVVAGGDGGSVQLRWTEALYREPEARTKGNRDIWEGKYFVGIGDTFLPDGTAGRRFDTLWWQAGRFLELVVKTAAQPLTIERLLLHETRYPLEMESAFAASDTRLAEITPILERGMQMCAHETYMDCPYYEELMYAGDTRLEMLTTYVMSRDIRLPRKALQMFDVSRLPSGLTQARFPSRVPQIIAPFSLWWVGMVCDYALWRDDLATVERLMPGVRATTEAFQRFIGADGLLHAPEGWNTLDWVPSWIAGIPPDANSGVNGLMNWQLVQMLELVAELEARLGEPELAARNRRLARALADRATAAFWDEERGLFADDLAHANFSEHTQCFAILSGLLEPERTARVAQRLLQDGDLARTSLYFTHYL